ncbi:g11416 [Coccomyxa viridis]|uniref:G11416 protein n=1 Tax=Coccomyxa viridis TaxID=1274662 RepID=A0ABP1GAG4_9CHLO
MFRPILDLRVDTIKFAARPGHSHLCSITGFTGLQNTGRRLRCRSSRIRSSTDEQVSASGDEERLLQDIERFRQREQLSSSQSRSTRPDVQVPSQSGGSALKEVLDKVLIADFFFVCAALAWLVAGAGANTFLSNSALIDAWFPLWQWVFQPAIGTLMLGALVSGAVGKLQKGSDE